MRLETSSTAAHFRKALIYSVLNRTNLEAGLVEQVSVDDVVTLDIIVPSQLKWASHVMSIMKQEESLRFCIDYRRLNSMTARDFYPFFVMDEC